MATISTMAVKLTLQTAGVAEGLKTVVDTLGKVAGKVTGMNGVIKGSANAWNAADKAAQGHLKTLLKIAGAGSAAAVVKRGVGAFTASGGEASNLPGANDAQKTAAAFQSVRDALNGVFVAFGSAFSQAGNLAGAATTLRNVIQSMTPVFSALGTVAGVAFRILTAFAPILIAVALAFKLVSAALGLLIAGLVYLAQVILVRMIVQWVTLMALGTAMTPMMLGLAAATWVWNAAMAVAAALGAPVWLAIAAAIGVVVAAAAGLYAIWKWMSGSNKQTDRIEEMKAIADATRDATKDARAFVDALEESNLTAGMTEAEKKAHEFGKLLDKAGADLASKGISFDRGALEQQLQHQLAIAEAADKRKKVAEALLDLEKQLADVGMSEAQRAAAKVQAAGGTGEDIARASALAQQIEDKKTLLQQAKEIADIEKAASLAGLSDTEKRLAALREAGATEERIAAVRKTLEQADAQTKAAENRKKLEEEIAKLQQDAAMAFMTDAEKRLAMFEKMGASMGQLATVKAADQKIADAQNAKNVIESVKTPKQKFDDSIGMIAGLQNRGAIDAATAGLAGDKALKDLQGNMRMNSGEVASPKALLKGSAEANLAENRAKNPIDRLTDINKKQLDEAKAARAALDKIKENFPGPLPVFTGTI